jgi:CrcB protein
MLLVLIALGGALGAVARYLFSSAVMRTIPTLFPAGTFVVNVLGCVVFGLLAGLADERFALGPDLRGFLLIGVLGGFTTFSSFAFESVELLRDGQLAWATLNLGGQVVAGVIGLWVGYVLTS